MKYHSIVIVWESNYIEQNLLSNKMEKSRYEQRQFMEWMEKREGQWKSVRIWD